MQFAGQRTDMNLKPIGYPLNVLIKLTPDVLPDPDAILVTGVTPQHTLADGLTEADFLKLFYEKVVTPGTIFTGFNSVRFDDEFMRFLHYRNFYDPYEWHWANSCSRWDILDVVRMTRALRPEGIEWPVDAEGKPTNRLELLTAANKLDHFKAHDALSDVNATISVASLIRDKQKDLFDYLLGMRDKRKVGELVESGQPFVYTSGRYPSATLHTTAAVVLSRHKQSDAALVYDLRQDPAVFLDMSVDELVEAWKFNEDPEAPRLPVKTLKYNRCPAVAPLGVIKDDSVQKRLDLSLETVSEHLAVLKQHRKVFAEKVIKAVERLDVEREERQIAVAAQRPPGVDSQLYDGFLSDQDRQKLKAVRESSPEGLGELLPEFHDRRLQKLLPLYKARNYPSTLTDEERQAWESFCRQQLFEGDAESRIVKYFNRLSQLGEGSLTSEQQYLLEELKLYGESIVPSD